MRITHNILCKKCETIEAKKSKLTALLIQFNLQKKIYEKQEPTTKSERNPPDLRKEGTHRKEVSHVSVNTHKQ